MVKGHYVIRYENRKPLVYLVNRTGQGDGRIGITMFLPVLCADADSVVVVVVVVRCVYS